MSGHKQEICNGDASLQRLWLERELHHILVRYARLCDERDWAAIDTVFDENASARYGGWHLPDRAAILAMLRDNLGAAARPSTCSAIWSSRSMAPPSPVAPPYAQRIGVSVIRPGKPTTVSANTVICGFAPAAAGALHTAP